MTEEVLRARSAARQIVERLVPAPPDRARSASELHARMRAAVDETEARHPGLSDVVTRCLVGWLEGTSLEDPVVRAGLIVKVGEWADEGGTLNFDAIPIERHWSLRMMMHDRLGHSEPWEVCGEGCDEIASQAIRVLFGKKSTGP